MLLWLWHRQAAAAPIQPLPCQLQCARGTAIKTKQNKKTNKQKNPKTEEETDIKRSDQRAMEK